MRFVATLSHSPDNCWAREQNEEMAREWIANVGQKAEENDVGLHAAYAAPNEHRFYFVLEADSFENVTRFLGPPALQDHDGDITPVLEFESVTESVLDD
jgi:hypothetical protein